MLGAIPAYGMTRSYPPVPAIASGKSLVCTRPFMTLWASTRCRKISPSSVFFSFASATHTSAYSTAHVQQNADIAMIRQAWDTAVPDTINDTLRN